MQVRRVVSGRETVVESQWPDPDPSHAQGEMDAALVSGTRLWGACTEAELGGDEEGGGVEAEASWGDLLQPKYFKAASIAFLIFLFQQVTGPAVCVSTVYCVQHAGGRLGERRGEGSFSA